METAMARAAGLWYSFGQGVACRTLKRRFAVP
jgi:hypothetical protein